MTIPFTQYLRPHGHRQHVEFIPMADQANTQAIALKLIAAGYRFEAEVLTTGEVSLTVVDEREDAEIAIEVCPNGPEVIPAISRLVAKAAAIAWAPDPQSPACSE